MRNPYPHRPTPILLILAGLALLPTLAYGEEPPDASPGQEAFAAARCNLCHAVASVGIEAKSSKTEGPDLGGLVVEELEALAAYLRKETEIEGEEHKKTFKGTDEELQVIVDWLAGLEPVGDS